MNKDSNIYTLIYASVMVILVALILAYTSETLRPQQAKNEAIDKMRQILTSINVESTNANAEELYDKLIVDTYLINSQGNKVDGNAFAVELTEELRKPIEERNYPVLVADIEGSLKYVLSLRGAGLWGPLWGFISLDDDKKTIYGASFGHAGETPGLGAEIEKPFFAQAFIGKRIFNQEGTFTSVAIVKPGRTVQGKDYVDGISGGTITGQGVDAMLFSGLEAYKPFLTKE
ncbi:MAG: NADH:ubiquinone reductase (Na(+)-transporting) subunit C [Dysgonamonadaceae bacterium]|jgi:Na+-transporting NADH:ubiquinone oxidoreductase subunit C|nr:NADH:ubiquinone reductase (Na(+)-transporting) subunit C [Dysgonamonadaceae bacterium]